MIRRPVLVLAAVAALGVAAPAAEAAPGPGSAGTLPGLPPAIAALLPGGALPELPEITDVDLTSPTPVEEDPGAAPSNDVPVGDEGTADDDPAAEEEEGLDLPELSPAFLARTWKLAAEADGFEDGVLSVTIDHVVGLPAAFADEGDLLESSDAEVLVARGTKVLDARHRPVTRRSRVRRLLDRADEVRVEGKVLDPEDWNTDEDGAAVVTVRAKRITVIG